MLNVHVSSLVVDSEVREFWSNFTVPNDRVDVTKLVKEGGKRSGHVIMHAGEILCFPGHRPKVRG